MNNFQYGSDPRYRNSNSRSPEEPKNGLATVSLILGLLSLTIGWFLCCMPGILGLPAIITGHSALSQNRAQPMVYGGVGMATSGLVMGYLSVLFTAGIFIAAAFAPDSDISPSKNDYFEQWVDKSAPDFSIKTIDDKRIFLSNLRGRRVIVDFWATWCPPCKEEIPHFIRLAKEYKTNELTIIGISNEPESKLRQFALRNGINYLVASDELDFEPYNNITGIPTTFFLDGDGVIRDIHVGYMDYKEIKDAAFK